MKRFWIILFFSLVFVVVYDLIFGLVEYYVADSTYMLLITFFTTVIVLGSLLWINKRKNPIVLTEEERNAPIVERQDFGNDNRMWMLVLVFVILLGSSFVFPFRLQIIQVLMGELPFDALVDMMCQIYARMIRHTFSFMLMMAIALGLPVWLILRSRRNRYLIEGDTLIIQEFRAFKTEEEIRIPINAIDEVYLQGPSFVLYPPLIITVCGVKRRLSLQRGLELGKAILQHKLQLQQES